MSTARSGVEIIFNDFKLTCSKGDTFSGYLGQLSGAFHTKREKKENLRNLLAIRLFYHIIRLTYT